MGFANPRPQHSTSPSCVKYEHSPSVQIMQTIRHMRIRCARVAAGSTDFVLSSCKIYQSVANGVHAAINQRWHATCLNAKRARVYSCMRVCKCANACCCLHPAHMRAYNLSANCTERYTLHTCCTRQRSLHRPHTFCLGFAYGPMEPLRHWIFCLHLSRLRFRLRLFVFGSRYSGFRGRGACFFIVLAIVVGIVRIVVSIPNALLHTRMYNCTIAFMHTS